MLSSDCIILLLLEVSVKSGEGHPLSPGAKLRVVDDTYLREDGPLNARSSAAILGVAKEGDALQVVDVDYSHAKGGGWFVWAKVRRT
jgi:hypothetical protein